MDEDWETLMHLAMLDEMNINVALYEHVLSLFGVYDDWESLCAAMINVQLEINTTHAALVDTEEGNALLSDQTAILYASMVHATRLLTREGDGE